VGNAERVREQAHKRLERAESKKRLGGRCCFVSRSGREQRVMSEFIWDIGDNF
jgi:hypothetical protein